MSLLLYFVFLGLCPRNIREGLLNIEKVVKRDKIRGAYGPLVNLFSLSNDAFRVPVEVIAKNQLFNYVVDTEATAALLIKELQKVSYEYIFACISVL